MKISVVPAQITTVEDKIAGNLGLSQLLLLAAPIFLGSAAYAILPPIFKGASYKVFVAVILAVFCGLLAIRIKGKLVLFWLVTLLRFNLRPRFYVYDKRTNYAREDYRTLRSMTLEDEPVIVTQRVRQALSLSPADVMKLEDLIANPDADVRFETNKSGGLHVRITEIKQEI